MDRIALLTCRTGNIGDHIQSLAAMRLAPRIDEFADRDDLAGFRPTRPTKLVCNGWLTHRPENFIFHRNVSPLLTSLHICNSPFLGTGGSAVSLGDLLINVAAMRDQFRLFGPVGARDHTTLGLLRDLGVPAFFSGCLTLTLPRIAEAPRHGAVVLCDVPDAVAGRVAGVTTREVKRISHAGAPDLPPRDALRQAEDVLAFYQGAHLVITTRLHCALPSLAMGVPVILIEPSFEPERFTGLKDLVNILSLESCLGLTREQIEEPPANPTGHLALRDTLTAQVKDYFSRDAATSTPAFSDQAFSVAQGISRFIAGRAVDWRAEAESSGAKIALIKESWPWRFIVVPARALKRTLTQGLDERQDRRGNPSIPEAAGRSRRPRILAVIGNLDVGGVEMDIIRNLPRIDRDRFDISVYVHDKPGVLADRLRETGIPLICPPGRSGASRDAAGGGCHPGLPKQRSKLRRWIGRTVRRMRMTWVKGTVSTLRAVPSLAWCIARRRIDVVHCFLPDSYMAGGLATSLFPRCKLVMSRVSKNHYQDERPDLSFVERRILHPRVAAVACNTRDIERELVAEGVAAAKIRLIHNGIDAAAYAPSPERRQAERAARGLTPDQTVLSVVANLHPYKGHDDLLQALSGIRDKLPANWVLLCAGRDEGRKADYEALAHRLGLGEHVVFLGQCFDVPGLLASSDLAVLPSHQEGLPNSVLEAMASGLPVVATDVGGLPELIVPEKGGFLVPPHDPRALGEAILTVLKDADACRSMGRYNLDRARERFSLEASVGAYTRLYDSLEGDLRQ